MDLGSAEALVYLPARPDLFLEIYLGEPYRAASGGAPPSAVASDVMLISPHVDRRVTLHLSGWVHAFHISLQPTAVHRLFGVPSAGLVDEAVEGRAVLGYRLDLLRDGVLAARDFEGRVRAAARWFADRLEEARPEDGVDFSARMLRRAGGRLPLARLAARAELGERQWRRRFRHQAGLAPKLYARIARLNVALDLGRSHPHLDGSELALRSGYFDQSHLLRETRDLLGATPAAWLARP